MESLLFIYSITLLVAVLISGRAERTVLSTAVLFLGVGIICGNGFLRIFSPKPGSPLVYHLAELALFAVLYTDSMRISPDDFRGGGWQLPARALVLGLPLAVIATALLAHFMVGLLWLDSLLLGAILAPTDPVFAAAIFKFREIPSRLQRLLNIESGLNDGLALPIVVFLLSRRGFGPESPLLAVGEMALGIAIGVIIPWTFIRIIRLSFFGSSDLYRPLAGVSMALLVYSVCTFSHANVFLAAFSGGFTISAISEKATRAFTGFGELITELLKLAALLVFGSLLTASTFHDIHVSGVLFCVLVLVAVRPASLVLALYKSELSLREWVTAAWFGPKGFASVVYTLLVIQVGFPGSLKISQLVAIVVALSIIAHSSTDILVARWFIRASKQSQVETDRSSQSAQHIPN